MFLHVQRWVSDLFLSLELEMRFAFTNNTDAIKCIFIGISLVIAGAVARGISLLFFIITDILSSNGVNNKVIYMVLVLCYITSLSGGAFVFMGFYRFLKKKYFTTYSSGR